jgi:hypothetical protein
VEWTRKAAWKLRRQTLSQLINVGYFLGDRILPPSEEEYIISGGAIDLWVAFGRLANIKFRLLGGDPVDYRGRVLFTPGTSQFRMQIPWVHVIVAIYNVRKWKGDYQGEIRKHTRFLVPWKKENVRELAEWIAAPVDVQADFIPEIYDARQATT